MASQEVTRSVLLAGSMFTGCGDDNGGGPALLKISDLEGSWNTTTYTVTSRTGEKVTIDLIELGAAFSFEVADDGSFEGRFFLPAAMKHFPPQGKQEETPAGDFALIDQDTILINVMPDIPPLLTDTRGAFTLDGKTLSFTDTDAMLDLDGDQQPDPAIAEATLELYSGDRNAVIFIEDFEGHWEAQEYRMTSKANPQRTFEIIAAGATLEMDIDSGGDFTGDLFLPSAVTQGDPVTIDDFLGSLEIDYQDTVRTLFTPEHEPFLTNTYGPFTLDGDRVEISDDNTTFDFGFGDGEEPVLFEGVMERTGKAK